MEDAVITVDEQAIIDKIKHDTSHLHDQAMNILVSELPDDEFLDIITHLLEDIIVNAEKVALQDGVITADESNILQKLRELITGEKNEF